MSQQEQLIVKDYRGGDNWRRLEFWSMETSNVLKFEGNWSLFLIYGGDDHD